MKIILWSLWLAFMLIFIVPYYVTSHEGNQAIILGALISIVSAFIYYRNAWRKKDGK